MSALSQVPNLRELVDKYKLEVFVETGCDRGDGLRTAAELGFNERYSCDLNPGSVKLCRGPVDVVFNLDSRTFLKTINVFNFKPTLFWLDAHFPWTWGTETDDPDLIWPLALELDALRSKQNISRDVVICDDICTLQSDDNPTWREGQDERCVKRGFPLRYLSKMLPLRATIHNIDTGILVLEPR